MLKIKRLLSLFLFVFFSILSFPIQPSLSQSSLNACFTSPAAASECSSLGLISPQSAANAVRGSLVNPSPINPFINAILPSKEVVTVVGGVAALLYLRPSDLQKLKDNAPASKQYSNGRWRAKNFVSGAVTGWSNDVTPDRIENYNSGGYSVPNIFYKYGASNGARSGQVLGDVWGSQTFGQVDFEADTSAGTLPAALAPDVSRISNDAIFALAAAGAAAAANNLSSPDLNRLDAALAAIAAAGLVGAGSPDYPLAQEALNSAQAAASSLAAGAAAKAQQDTDKALADKLANPSSLPSKSFSDSKNFVSYAVVAFSRKFPFDLIYGATDSASPLCPSFSLFYYKWELCFLMPIFLTIRWIVFISISTKAVLEL